MPRAMRVSVSQPGNISGDERPPVDRASLGQREQRRQDRRRRMSAQRVAAIVEVERVRRGAVDQRRIQRCHALIGAEHEARAPFDAVTRADDPRARLACAGQRAADRVEDRDARPMHRILRQRVVADTGDPFGQRFGDGHDCPPARAVARVATGVALSRGTGLFPPRDRITREHQDLSGHATPLAPTPSPELRASLSRLFDDPQEIAPLLDQLGRIDELGNIVD